MKSFAGIALLFVLLGVPAEASFTLQISQSGFANSSSVPTNGMPWGIVVDTGGSAGTNLSLLSSGIDPLTVTNDGFLSVGGSQTPDFYFFNHASLAANQVTTNGGPPSFSPGFISSTGALSLGSNGVATGDQFAVIWFQTDGSASSKYGFFTNSNLVLPQDGSTTSYSSFIPSTAKPANLTIQAVPEPASLWLIALGLLSLWGSRRFVRRHV